MHVQVVALCFLILPAARRSILDGTTVLSSVLYPTPGASVSPGAAVRTSFRQCLAAVPTSSGVGHPAGDPLGARGGLSLGCASRSRSAGSKGTRSLNCPVWMCCGAHTPWGAGRHRPCPCSGSCLGARMKSHMVSVPVIPCPSGIPVGLGS